MRARNLALIVGMVGVMAACSTVPTVPAGNVGIDPTTSTTEAETDGREGAADTTTSTLPESMSVDTDTAASPEVDADAGTIADEVSVTTTSVGDEADPMPSGLTQSEIDELLAGLEGLLAGIGEMLDDLDQDLVDVDDALANDEGDVDQ